MSNFLKEIPSEIKKFIIKSLMIFIFWKIIYHSLLQPFRIIDKPLTDFTTTKTVQVYNNLNKNSDLFYIQNKQSNRGTVIIKKNTKVIGIDDGCNALELMIIFVAFLLCIPTKRIKRLISFIIGGLLLIFILNLIRCYLLIYIHFQYPSIMDFAHHYFFNIVVYAVIFVFWVQYLKYKPFDEKK